MLMLARIEVQGSQNISKEDMCHECNLTESDGVEWIECDICDMWYHRQYVHLRDDEWDAFQGDEEFKFHKCL